MNDPLQYLRDLQVTSVPPARPPAPRGVPAAAVPPGRDLLAPTDLPALALSILAEGRAPAPASEHLYLQRRTLPGGARCSLPIRYFDARCVIAEFSIPRALAADALRPFGVQPAGAGGGATALFGCFQYRDSDLGPYNEVGLSIPATAPGDSEPALYVLHLPVTTAETDRIGRALWGYPKFVAGIDVGGDARGFTSKLRDPSGALIAEFDGLFAALRPSPAADLPTYSRLDGQILRTRIEALTPFQEGAGAGFSLKVGPSNHPMAETLRALGLDGARPQSVRRGDPFQAMLFPGFPV
jgi:hypothetical protein